MARPRPSAPLAVTVALVGAACRGSDAPPPTPRPAAPPVASAPATPPPVRTIAATREPLTMDGELAEPSWNALGDPQPFQSAAGEARPYSQIRLLHDADRLYVGLYAADQEILSDQDRFQLTIGALALSVDPLGRLTPPVPEARVGKDVDGTIDKAGDEDEEWVIELSLPLAATGLRADGAPVGLTARRCDTPKDGATRCGEWTRQVRLGP